MNPRIAISLGVFVVGFGLGYGATYMLVGSGNESATEETPVPTAAISNENSATDGGGEGKKQAEESANSGEPKAEPKPNKGKSPSSVRPSKGAEPKKEPMKVEVKKASSQPGEKWWEACLGKLCGVDFGGIKTGLSIRKGTLTHKQTVDWNLRFRRAKRINILPTDRKVKLKLIAVGFDAKGKPAAAHISWKDNGVSISGVISLQPGNRRVQMLPLTAE